MKQTPALDQVRRLGLTHALIAEHGFYLGRGSACRRDPGRLARVLQPANRLFPLGRKPEEDVGLKSTNPVPRSEH